MSIVDPQKLVEAAEQIAETIGQQANAAALQKHYPTVVDDLEQLKSARYLLSLWGLSRNRDEDSDSTIVSPQVLNAIGSACGTPMPPHVAHAGLMHTYGYLFSLLETPHGYKRERWTKPVLDQAFGFDGPVLQALPNHGTLLGNVTYFLGRIAFRGRRRELSVLRKVRPQLPPALLEFRYRRLKRQRITETIRLRRRGPTPQQVELVTDLVAFANRPAAADNLNSLLVYSVVDTRRDLAQLITAFPVRSETVQDLVAGSPFGRRVEIHTRYNAFVAEITGEVQTGARVLS